MLNGPPAIHTLALLHFRHASGPTKPDRCARRRPPTPPLIKSSSRGAFSTTRWLCASWVRTPNSCPRGRRIRHGRDAVVRRASELVRRGCIGGLAVGAESVNLSSSGRAWTRTPIVVPSGIGSAFLRWLAQTRRSGSASNLMPLPSSPPESLTFAPIDFERQTLAGGLAAVL